MIAWKNKSVCKIWSCPTCYKGRQVNKIATAKQYDKWTGAFTLIYLIEQGSCTILVGVGWPINLEINLLRSHADTRLFLSVLLVWLRYRHKISKVHCTICMTDKYFNGRFWLFFYILSTWHDHFPNIIEVLMIQLSSTMQNTFRRVFSAEQSKPWDWLDPDPFTSI